MKLTVGASLVMAVLVASSSAWAGDPCPIRIPVVDLGIPDWAKPSLAAKVKDGDAFLARLAKAGNNGKQCTTSKVIKADGDEFPMRLYDAKISEDKLAVSAIKSKLVDGKRRFQCKSAKRTLAYLKGLSEADGSVIAYRGHSRILLVVPGWRSMCISAKKADAMSDKKAAALFRKLTGALVKDRHDNP